MDYFPIFLDLRTKKILVIGGGVIAWRKVKLIAGAGGRITLVAPTILPELAELVKHSQGTIHERKFEPADLDESSLVYVAIDDSQVEQEIYDLTVAKNIPINVVDNQALCTFITPAIVERDPIVVAISSGGAGPVVARRLREELEARLPADYGALASLMDEVRPLVQEKLPEEKRRYFYEQLWDSRAAQLLADGKQAEAKELALQILAEEQPAGMVWLAGAGPGGAAQLTLQTLQLMHQADVILHDKLVGAEVLAMARRDATLVSVAKPQNSQAEINQMMVDHAREGKRVLRLKGGDPTIFGRLNEEMTHLAKHKIDYAVVPGITAVLAAAAGNKMSLTDRDLAHGLVFLSLQAKTAAADKAKRQLNPYVSKLLRDNAGGDRTLVIYMGVDNIDLGVAELLAAGMDAKTPALIFEKIGHAEQRTLASQLQDLPQTMADQQVVSPTSIVIGQVAKKFVNNQ